MWKRKSEAGVRGWSRKLESEAGWNLKKNMVAEAVKICGKNLLPPASMIYADRYTPAEICHESVGVDQSSLLLLKATKKNHVRAFF